MSDVAGPSTTVSTIVESDVVHDAAAHWTSALDLSVGKKIAIDVVAAAAASFLVSPTITAIDRAIIENASGKRVLMQGIKDISMEFVRNPVAFVRRKDFLLIYGLYVATYATANATDTVCELMDTDNKMPKLIGTTAVNVSLCVAKDREYARMFGLIAPTKFPITSLGLFAMRDALSVGATFVAPPLVSHLFENQLGASPSASHSAALLLCPSLAQLVSTPLHLLSLDLYNHKVATPQARLAFISKEYIKSAAARISRTLPAFGVGGIGNKHMRERMRATWL
ncbi:hypothetical protein H310_08350 [Aphanomyces invadans]|uniref:Uncharacterized protein n=1 Tax=Aphanomyces invadans TaxID=157072 RepID=A0A024TXY5_9STRA|nr:hypothetical protein H310_08350 [Aphanomyces invadans]ETV98849.1 hypothetical protein H310_08350 [Aphanomyces invadans]|eukprot:XP_008872277.1 hypothetical protein H310_08350 [Aphanomyces invadans]